MTVVSSAVPDSGTPVLVEVRDTAVADAAAVVVASGQAEVTAAPGSDVLARVSIEVDAALVVAGSLTVFAHVAAGGAGEVSAGDLISVQSYPVTAATAELVVAVVRVG